MSRRRAAVKREILPDPKFSDLVVAKFINCMMWAGKRSVSERIVYNAMDQVRNKTGNDPMQAFHGALENVSPSVEVRSRRVGGATYQVPMEVDSHRQFALATRWIIGAARDRSGKSFADKLASEFMDAANGQGSAVRKREEAHRMAEANRAFSHYRV